MGYVPKNIADMVDRFAVMATKAPKYEQMYNPEGDPAGEFDLTYQGLDNVKDELGDRVWEHLRKRTDENWIRLQSGSLGSIKALKLSFGEMAYFLQSGAYIEGVANEEFNAYTDLP